MINILNISKYLLAILSFCIFSNTVNAAQVCTGLAGTYGGITLTRSGACADFSNTDGMINTSALSGFNCSISFSPAVSASQLSVKLSNVDTYDQVGFSFGATPYTLVPADVDTVSTPPTSAGSLSIVANQLTSPTSGVAGAGTISFTNSPPATVQSLDLNKTGSGAVIFQLCFDDVAIATSPTAIPTLGEWAMLLLASLVAMFAIRRMRNR